jgi:hypothetical protein
MIEQLTMIPNSILTILALAVFYTFRCIYISLISEVFNKELFFVSVSMLGVSVIAIHDYFYYVLFVF